MPDTTNRPTPSAAEVMGWNGGHRMSVTDPFVGSSACSLCGVDLNTALVTCCSKSDDEPTPDDMLAWLRERGRDIDVATYLNEEPVTITIGDCESAGYDPDVVPTFTAPTLHAALEQAVIAVGRAE